MNTYRNVNIAANAAVRCRDMMEDPKRWEISTYSIDINYKSNNYSWKLFDTKIHTTIFEKRDNPELYICRIAVYNYNDVFIISDSFKNPNKSLEDAYSKFRAWHYDEICKLNRTFREILN